MEYRKLGSSDLKVSVIGFGAWGIGGAPFWSTEGDTMSVKSIKKAFDLGINFVSNYSVQEMQDCLKTGPLVSLQPEYSLLQRAIEKETVPFCLIHEIGVIAYSPLASGVLTGKYDRDTKFKDWRSKGIIGQFTGEAYQRNIEKVERLKKIAEAAGKTCGQMAVNWVVRQPGVASALVGVKNDRQVEENLKSAGWQPDAPVQDEIDRIFAVEG